MVRFWAFYFLKKNLWKQISISKISKEKIILFSKTSKDFQNIFQISKNAPLFLLIKSKKQNLNKKWHKWIFKKFLWKTRNFHQHIRLLDHIEAGRLLCLQNIWIEVNRISVKHSEKIDCIIIIKLVILMLLTDVSIKIMK